MLLMLGSTLTVCESVHRTHFRMRREDSKDFQMHLLGSASIDQGRRKSRCCANFLASTSQPHWTLFELTTARKSSVTAKLKTRRSYRTIQMSGELAVILQEHIEAYGVGSHGLIIQNRYGVAMGYKNARNMFSEYAKELGTPVGQGIHLLRHTCAANLIREGVHAKVIQLFLGYGTFQITMDIYGHLFPSESASIKEHLDAAATRVKTARHASNPSVAL